MLTYSPVHIPACIAILCFLNFADPVKDYYISDSQPSSGKSQPATGEDLAIERQVPATTVFVGRTPCREFAQDYGIAVPADCFKLKWKITLTRDQVSDKSGTYLLQTTFNRQKDITGTWTETKDPESAGHTIYQLNDIQNGKNLYLLSLDNQVVFLLTGQKQLYRGNEEFSYTLNRESAGK